MKNLVRPFISFVTLSGKNRPGDEASALSALLLSLYITKQTGSSEKNGTALVFLKGGVRVYKRIINEMPFFSLDPTNFVDHLDLHGPLGSHNLVNLLDHWLIDTDLATCSKHQSLLTGLD